MEKIENKMTLTLITEGLYTMQRNGMDLVCPFIPPMPIRQRVNSQIIGNAPQEQIGIQKTACNSGCPLFKIDNNESISVHCGGSVLTHKIDKIIDILDKPSSGNVIPMSGVGGKA